MNETREFEFYEAIGVKKFKKIILKIFDSILLKSEEKERIYKYRTNYHIGKVGGLEDIKRYKKWLWFNALIHICCFFSINFSVLELIKNSGSLFNIIWLLILDIINVYCVILQRYNCIRINRLVKRHEKGYEERKSKIREEVINRNNDEYVYKLIDKKGREKSINLIDFTSGLNIQELRKIREYLVSGSLENDRDGVLSINRGKVLRIWRRR